ncbi:hypothetical protein, partial [Parafannyhessea sp. LCP19S3_B1]|uniref:hypothetical protein n=1 Tax=Parafannyhessea sp. LCP19S3_B1 TaxID=3438795 RepID=UPI003F9AAD06
MDGTPRYTDEERAHYLRTMWAEGLVPATAARLWGNHPNRHTLTRWQREAREGALEVEPVRVPHSCAGRHLPHKRYPADTREEALRLLRLGRRSGEVARSLGLPNGSLVGRWARKERERASMAADAGDGGGRKMPAGKRTRARKGGAPAGA